MRGEAGCQVSRQQLLFLLGIASKILREIIAVAREVAEAIAVLVDLQPLPVILGLHVTGTSLQPLVQGADGNPVGQLRLEGLHQLDGDFVESDLGVLETLAHLPQVGRHVKQIPGIWVETLEDGVDAEGGAHVLQD